MIDRRTSDGKPGFYVPLKLDLFEVGDDGDGPTGLGRTVMRWVWYLTVAGAGLISGAYLAAWIWTGGSQ